MFKCTSLHNWGKSSDLQCLEYWKMHLWNSLCFGMIWSLIHHMSNSPPQICPKSFFLRLLRKAFIKKGLPILMGTRSYAHAPLEDHVGYVLPQFLRGSGLKPVNILGLAKMRIVWHNRLVGWGIIKKLAYCQSKPLWALHQDLNSSWSSFWLSS